MDGRFTRGIDDHHRHRHHHSVYSALISDTQSYNNAAAQKVSKNKTQCGKKKHAKTKPW